MDNIEYKPRTLWEKGEALFGKNLLIIIVAVVGFMFWSSIVPFVLLALENTVQALLMFAAAVVLLYGMFSADARFFWYNMTKKIGRFLFGWMVKVDPLGNMKTYRDVVRDEEIPKIKASLDQISGTVISYQKQIEENETQIDKLEKQAKFAESRGDAKAADGFYEDMGTYQTSNENMLPMLKELQTHEAFFTNLKDLAEYFLRKINTELKVKENELKLYTQGTMAIGAAKKAMGSGQQYELFKASSEEITNRYNGMLGEIRNLTMDSQKYINDMTYEKGANVEKGREMMRAFEERRKALKQQMDQPLLESAKQSPVTLTVPTTSKVNVTTDKKLF